MIKTFELLASNIKNLELKLAGKLPVNRDELLALANTWGRFSWFYTYDKDGNEIEIKACELKEKYNLSKLDVSQITNFDKIFFCSNFNVGTSMKLNGLHSGNINSWDVSKGTSMEYMFNFATNFNSPLDKWDVSNVTSMFYMFSRTIFNQNLNSWDISKVIDFDCIFANIKNFNQPILWDLSNAKYCRGLFYSSKAFEDRFNNGNQLPFKSEEIKKWLKDNQELMIALDIKDNKAKELNKFILNISLQNKSFIEKIFIKLKFKYKNIINLI